LDLFGKPLRGCYNCGKMFSSTLLKYGICGRCNPTDGDVLHPAQVPEKENQGVERFHMPEAPASAPQEDLVAKGMRAMQAVQTELLPEVDRIRGMTDAELTAYGGTAQNRGMSFTAQSPYKIKWRAENSLYTYWEGKADQVFDIPKQTFIEDVLYYEWCVVRMQSDWARLIFPETFTTSPVTTSTFLFVCF
jgi:hypothetical protein